MAGRLEIAKIVAMRANENSDNLIRLSDSFNEAKAKHVHIAFDKAKDLCDQTILLHTYGRIYHYSSLTYLQSHGYIENYKTFLAGDMGSHFFDLLF
jgi:hypothetical protein